MYHIFLIIALNSSQAQIEQTKSYIEQQKSSYWQIEKKDKKEETKLAIKEENQKKQPDELDVIAQLEKELKEEEAALKPDLESLGLDNLADFQTATKEKNADENKEAVITAKTADNNQFLTNNKNQSEFDPKISNLKPPIVKSEELPQPKEKELSKEDNLIKTINKKTKEIANKEEVKQTIKKAQKEISKIAKSSSEEIKKLPQKAPKEKPLNIDNQAEKEIKIPQKTKIDAKKPTNQSEAKTAKIEQKNDEIETSQDSKENDLVQLKKQIRAKKIADLRKKYLQKLDEEDIEGIPSHYSTIAKIVPQKKIPPKFINTIVPPQLRNRFRDENNKHHPFIVSHREKINMMFKAIARNQIGEFNALFKGIKDPNIKNSFGDTLLTFAVLMRRYDAISSLLAKGANPDLTNDLGYTPLNIAIEMIDHKAALLLIDMGAKVDFIDKLGRTYLMQSARVGSLPITDLLVSKGIDINIADNNGVTALAIAYKHKKDIVAKYLLKYGAKSWLKKDYIENQSSMIEDLFNKWQ